MTQVDVHLKRKVLSDLRAGASGKICRSLEKLPGLNSSRPAGCIETGMAGGLF